MFIFQRYKYKYYFSLSLNFTLPIYTYQIMSDAVAATQLCNKYLYFIQIRLWKYVLDAFKIFFQFSFRLLQNWMINCQFRYKKKRHKMEHSENLNSNKILHNFQFQKVNVYDNSSRYRFHHVFLLYHSTLLLFFYYFGITDLCVCIHKRTVRTLTHKISFKFYSLKSTMLNVNKLFQRKISLCF